MMSRLANVVIVVAVFSAGSAGVRADVFRDVAVGLGLAGFDIEGRRNVLNGGVDLSVSHNFVGNELDFGLADLTIQGPLSLSLSNGRRGLSTLELSLRTAINDQAPASPLVYSFSANAGSQSTQVSGQLFVDANVDFNGLGFYTVDLSYSSRQNVERRGTVDNSRNEYDFDIGPINVTGNVVADILTAFTEPFFSATGTRNPFAALSGRSQLQEVLSSSLEDSLTEFVNIANPVNDKAFVSAVGDGFPQTPGPNSYAVVPEPSVLVMTGLLSVAALSTRRRLC